MIKHLSTIFAICCLLISTTHQPVSAPSSATAVILTLPHMVTAAPAEATAMMSRHSKSTPTSFALAQDLPNTAARQDTARLANAPTTAAITPDVAWQAINTELKTASPPI